MIEFPEALSIMLYRAVELSNLRGKSRGGKNATKAFEQYFRRRAIYLFIYLFIYYFPTIKITQALHYTKMWRGDLRKPQGLYEEAPSLQ